MDFSKLPFHSASLGFIEGLYTDYLNDPKSVPDDWRRYFESSASGGPEAGRFLEKPQLGPSFRAAGLFNPPGGNGTGNGHGHGHGPAAAAGPLKYVEVAALQDRVDQLIRAYRVRGHMIAQVDPLGRNLADHPELDPAFYHLSEADMDRPFSSNTIEAQSVLTLRQIIQRMRNTYCRSIGVQFMHIDDIQVKHWLQKRMERSENRIRLTHEQQTHIFTRLTDAVTFEEFIQKKFVAAKSFSLEGAESLIPLMDMAITAAGVQGQDEIVIGMAHRGRLNVLANVMGKSARAIFAEFEDKDATRNLGRGDVKYHLGFSKDHITPTGHKIHLSLCFNPSHLEYVNAVALGRMRAKMDRVKDFDRVRGMAMLIHGDAAFAGEGVVQETLNLSMLEGYHTGGTLHIVVNNQIGFTTAPNESRSSIYSTDVAKMLESPIFHVNGEDPEAVATVVKLAMDFRRTFQRDVVIDMYCYRRRGHNESDEPAFTQPILYRAIEQRANVREGYLQHLLKLGELTREQADAIDEKRRKHLEEELSIARSAGLVTPVDSLQGVWHGYEGGKEADVPDVNTAVDAKRLAMLGERLTSLPTDFNAHPKIERLLEGRLQMAQGQAPIDWAMAEALAFASLATDGKLVRLSGQDCRRGTFSHRHAVLHDIEDGHTYFPLQNLSPGQAPVEIINSPLSEAGVLGFDYGYSLDTPAGLVMWEAQFGDFLNCAQVIVDQFISSAEDKWRRLSGLTLLLPHGMEGMGPEHSSARLERFLMLATEENIQVTQPTSPAQYFHLLRRQVMRAWRKPLFVMTPKSLLRSPQATARMSDLSAGGFQRVLDDPTQPKLDQIKRILLCSGKVYYDLHLKRVDARHGDTAILRLEQLYPFPARELQQFLGRYVPDVPVTWVQEEPENMGSWRYLRAMFGERLYGRALQLVSRPASASPATGSAASHKLEQKMLIDQSFK